MMTVADPRPHARRLRYSERNMVAQDGEQPGRHVGTPGWKVDVGQRTQQSFLRQVIRAIHVSAQGNRECAETRHRTENGFADRSSIGIIAGRFFPLPSRRLIRSLNRSGTPWFTTSSYMARSCWPSRACTISAKLGRLRVEPSCCECRSASIGFCCPTGFSFVHCSPQHSRGPGRAPVAPLV